MSNFKSSILTTSYTSYKPVQFTGDIWQNMTVWLTSSLLNFQTFIIMSCVIAVSVNFSTFLVIGKTSPVTYQVLGHLKTCLVLGFGYTLLHDPFTERNIIGILVAVFGMGLYSYFCTQENKKKLVVDPPLSSQVKKNSPIFSHSFSCSWEFCCLSLIIFFRLKIKI